MSVDTNAVIKKTNIGTLFQFANDQFEYAKVENTNRNNFYILSFKYKGEIRNVSVFTDDTSEIDFNIKGTLLSLGYWSYSVEIMKIFLNHFGGYLRESDMNDKIFYSVNVKEYNQDNELTEKDKMINEVVSNFGNENVDKFFEIFNNYKDKV